MPSFRKASFVAALFCCSSFASAVTAAEPSASSQADDATVSQSLALLSDGANASSGQTTPVSALPTTDVEATPAPTLMDLTAAPTDLWERVRKSFGLPDISGPLVREQEEWFAARPDYIRRTVARSSRYLYYIMQEVDKRGMPSEIALLPIIESAYNPVAYSPAHASGIWQFIPSTGKRYGLNQNFWYDGRRDVTAATSAALDYLQKLYDMFGSWDLALASYNWGEASVARAIAKNTAQGLPTDYQSLTLPAETRAYIPKLQAVKNIIANPAQFGITLAAVRNEPYFTAVTTDKHIDVKLAAKMADIPLDEFLSLNPGISRPVIQSNGSRVLLVPADKADTFVANLEKPGQPLVSWEMYTLKKGETLNSLAASRGITVARLKEINGINGQGRVSPGSTLLVPGAGRETAHLPELAAPEIKFAKVEPSPKKGAKSTAVARKPVPTATKVARSNSKPSVKKPTAIAAKKPQPPAKKVILAQNQKPAVRR